MRGREPIRKITGAEPIPEVPRYMTTNARGGRFPRPMGATRGSGRPNASVRARRHSDCAHGDSARAFRRPPARSRFSALAPLIVVLVGIAVMSYPFVSNLLAEYNASGVIERQRSSVDERTEAELSRARELAEEYNESLAGDPVHDPFIPGSGYALPDNYEEVLNIDGDGVMGSVEIPKIDVDLPIYHGTSEEVLERGVGHVEQTALPIGGENRHPVLTGHRGLPSAELFSRLDELERGDEFYITVLGETIAYKVDKISVVLPSEISNLQAEPGEDLCTLVTCTPYGVNTHRLLVRGSRVPYDPQKAASAANAASRLTPYQIGLLVGLALLLLLGVVLAVRARREPLGKHAR